MKKILLSVAVVAFVGTAVVAGTGAFFSDTESSTGNTFTAGAIDLTVDNHAWYNGLECANVAEQGDDPVWEWTDPGNHLQDDPTLAQFIGEPCVSSWELSDLDGHLFFEFFDLKPGDWEEDTISLHINNNDAWMCANLTVTKDDDISSTEPELEDGDDEDLPNDLWDGELGQELNFIFWADDGDNVLEEDEQIVLEGTPADLPSGPDNPGQTFPIADAGFSIFGEPGTPITGDETVYIGKAFCYGDLVLYPVTQDDLGAGDQGANSPADDAGFACRGFYVDNTSQTDSLMGDLSFYAIQSRNNGGFRCDEGLFPPSDVEPPLE